MDHSAGGSWWVLISMIAFSIMVLWFAWALLRRPKPDDSLEAEVLTQRYARGEIEPVEAVALTDGEVVTLGVLLPDLASLLALKLHARRVRQVDRGAVDLWTCLELLAAAGEIDEFADGEFDGIRGQLAIEFADDGPAMSVVTDGVTVAESARRRTRLRGLARAIG